MKTAIIPSFISFKFLFPISVIIGKKMGYIKKIKFEDIQFYYGVEDSKDTCPERCIEVLIELMEQPKCNYLSNMIRKAFAGYKIYIFQINTANSSVKHRSTVIPFCGQIAKDPYVFVQQLLKLAEDIIEFEGCEIKKEPAISSAEFFRGITELKENPLK